jgi:hypothetical protein
MLSSVKLSILWIKKTKLRTVLSVIGTGAAVFGALTPFITKVDAQDEIPVPTHKLTYAARNELLQA